jgi:DNA polymerase-3 subunit delta'
MAVSHLPVPEAALEHHLKSLGKSMQEWLAQKHVPPVLLLTGQNGIGKRTMCYFLAQWIFCEKTGFGNVSQSSDSEASLFGGGLFADPNPDAAALPKGTAYLLEDLYPCGTCIQCTRALKGSWVDFTEIRPDEDDDGNTGALKIDLFRKLKESVGFGSHEGGYRIFLIPDADRMTLQAANSVLKILEEPPKGWIFLLTASDPTLVLPTVLSRCQSMKLRPFDSDTLRKLLSAAGILGEKQKLGAALGGGSWGRAIALASDEVSEHRQMIFDFLERPQGALNPLVDWAAQNDRNFNLLSDQLELICLDLIRSTLTPAGDTHSWNNFDGARALSNHVELLLKHLHTPEASRTFWIARSERIARARREALTPVNRKLLIQDILIPWLEVS